MTRWLLIGLFRDKTRSLFPFLVVTVGVALVITLVGFMEGVFMGMVDMTAKLDTGHLRFVNKPFYDEEHLIPMDRALADQEKTLKWLKENSDPEIAWAPRIRWGAILDVPDENGETKTQTPVIGMAIDLLSKNSTEVGRLDLERSIVEGRAPVKSGEMLVGYKLAEALELKPGDTLTLIGQTFDGGLATDNYIAVGFIRFGVFAMDKRMALIDLADAQKTFYMEGMVTDWLGFLPPHVGYKKFRLMQEDINKRIAGLRNNPPEDWAKDDVPIILSILDQRNIGVITDKFEMVRGIIVGVFLFLMALVLWNAGILNVIHRYGEMGLRLAMGETHFQLLLSLVKEAVLIGTLGVLAGCLTGGALTYYLQEVGINMGDAFAKTGLMMNDVVRGRVSLEGFITGIIPGMTASVLGTLIAGFAIFKRSTANLFRELES
ncbi:MAG: ABC transporter permease [Nitrospinae bacterium]|nr:ABC transporter permease [Nitrospinota bacterium]